MKIRWIARVTVALAMGAGLGLAAAGPSQARMPDPRDYQSLCNRSADCLTQGRASNPEQYRNAAEAAKKGAHYTCKAADVVSTVCGVIPFIPRQVHPSVRYTCMGAEAINKLCDPEAVPLKVKPIPPLPKPKKKPVVEIRGVENVPVGGGGGVSEGFGGSNFSGGSYGWGAGGGGGGGTHYGSVGELEIVNEQSN